MDAIYCDRCKDTTETTEWRYFPDAFYGHRGFKHIRLVPNDIRKPDHETHECGWMTKVPQKV